MEIPSTEVWMAVGTLIGAAVVFAFATERALGKSLTRKEHSDICSKNQQQIQESLDRIESRLGQHIQDTREHRDRVANSLHSIGIKVAVIETKMKIAENE